jgi:phospholipid N-methyltransferase
MLAKRMAMGLRPGATVIELGAGTGTLTEAIRQAGVRDADLHLVEQDERLATILRQRFPNVSVHCVDADSLERVLPELVGRVDYVVSGLPILWFDRAKKTAILRAAFNMLSANGFLQQFTYLGPPPVGRVLMSNLGLTATLVGLAPLNLPPAFVYRFRRNGARAIESWDTVAKSETMSI